ncbi:TPA: hypothetical protein ACH3X1_015947 [Trebouxia sp. C0004]
MRSRVLVRSRGGNEANTTPTGVHKKRRKRDHVDSSVPTNRSLGQQDKVISFELPQLEALLQGIDPDQDNDSLCLPHAATNMHPLPSADWQSSLPGQVQDWQDPEDSAASAVRGLHTLSHSPVISLPDTGTFGQQQSCAHVCSSSQNTNSPDERHHAASCTSPAMSQSFWLPPCKAGWSGDAHQMPSEPVEQQTVPPFTLDKEQSHLQLLAADNLMSPQSLDAILDMPAMSFDSGQDMQALDLQPDTPQSQHMPTAAQQHLLDNTPHRQEHQLLPNEAHCHNQHQHEQQSYQGHEQQQHSSNAHEQQHFSGGLQQQQQQQQEAYCYGSGSQESGLQPLHSAPLASHQNSGSSLHWADSCPVPTALPNVIRKTSNDSTIDPNTGKMLVYGKAMAHYTTHVELPSVSALFTDISSRVSQKSWLASATPPKQPSSLAAKAAQRRRRRSTSSTPPPAVPPQAYSALAPHGAPLAQPQPPCGGFTALLHAPLLPGSDRPPDTSARHGEAPQLACAAPGNSYSQHTAAGINMSAVQQSNGNLVGGPDMHGKFAVFSECSNQGVQSGGMQLTPPEAVGARALAGLDPHLPVKPEPQRPFPTAPNRAHQCVSIAVVRPLSSGSHSLASPAAATGRLATAQVGNCGQGARLKVSNPAPAVRQGFGGILNGVVKEAAETATKRPPVFRYEDFKPVQLNCYGLLQHCAPSWGGHPLVLAEEAEEHSLI